MRAKRVAMDAGQLSARSFAGCDATCRAAIAQFGVGRPVADLGPADFSKLYAALARKHSIATMGREIEVVRGICQTTVGHCE